MQGEGNTGAEYQPTPSLENTGEATHPTQLQPSGAVLVYSQSISRRTRYICLRGLEE